MAKDLGITWVELLLLLLFHLSFICSLAWKLLELVHKVESGRPNNYKTVRPNLWRDGRIIKKMEGQIWPWGWIYNPPTISKVKRQISAYFIMLLSNLRKYPTISIVIDILSRNYTSWIFGLTVKFGLPVRPYGIFNSAFRFSIIRPSGFGLMDIRSYFSCQSRWAARVSHRNPKKFLRSTQGIPEPVWDDSRRGTGCGCSQKPARDQSRERGSSPKRYEASFQKKRHKLGSSGSDTKTGTSRKREGRGKNIGSDFGGGV